MTRLLVVEDEKDLAEGLRFNLEQEGYEVDIIDNGEAALQMLIGEEKRDYALVVLDVMLPGINGFDVVEEMRRTGQYVPTLILTARGHSEDVLRGFAAGADDYLVKPFDLQILLVRISGLLRRGNWMRAQSSAQVPETDVFTFGDKSVHFELLELHVRGEVFKLTVMEMNVLRHLIRNAGKPVARGAMLEAVWGLREDTDTRALDNFIVRLRRYLEDDPSRPRHLLSVRGVGYKFIAEPPADK